MTSMYLFIYNDYVLLQNFFSEINEKFVANFFRNYEILSCLTYIALAGRTFYLAVDTNKLVNHD